MPEYSNSRKWSRRAPSRPRKWTKARSSPGLTSRLRVWTSNTDVLIALLTKEYCSGWPAIVPLVTCTGPKGSELTPRTWLAARVVAMTWIEASSDQSGGMQLPPPQNSQTSLGRSPKTPLAGESASPAIWSSSLPPRMASGMARTVGAARRFDGPAWTRGNYFRRMDALVGTCPIVVVGKGLPAQQHSGPGQSDQHVSHCDFHQTNLQQANRPDSTRTIQIIVKIAQKATDYVIGKNYATVKLIADYLFSHFRGYLPTRYNLGCSFRQQAERIESSAGGSALCPFNL